MQRGDHPLVGTKNLFDEKVGVVFGLCQRHHAGRKKIVPGQLEGVKNRKCAQHVGNKSVCRLKVPDIISDQRLVCPRQLARLHRPITGDQLGSTQELSPGRSGQLEASWRIEFFQTTQNLVAQRLLWMPKDVKTPNPTGHRETDEKQNKHGPSEQPSIILAGTLRCFVVGILEPTAPVFVSKFSGHACVNALPADQRTRTMCRTRRSARRAGSLYESPHLKGCPHNQAPIPQETPRSQDRRRL